MPAQPPPGWYLDPDAADQSRWWDGARWTEQVSPRPAPDPAPVTTVRLRRPGRRAAIGWGAAAFVVLAYAANAASGGSSEPTAQGTPTVAVATSSSTTSESATSTSATVEPAQVTTTTSAMTPSSTSATTDGRMLTGALLAVTGVSDGDTIKVRTAAGVERIRIIGIDAPELSTNDCFAQKAASRMQSLVQSRSVRLTTDSTQADRDRYGRLLRHVWLSDGRSLGSLMIEGGFAREYTYAKPYVGVEGYRAAQDRARRATLGVWSRECTTGLPLVRPTATATPTRTPRAACDIKGNINSKGEHIYHLPGMRYYDQTVITLSKGERWFCSEAEAIAAGWRRSNV